MSYESAVKFSQNEWGELYDALELGLDALGEGPGDVDYNYLVSCLMMDDIELRLIRRRFDAANDAVI